MRIPYQREGHRHTHTHTCPLPSVGTTEMSPLEKVSPQVQLHQYAQKPVIKFDKHVSYNLNLNPNPNSNPYSEPNLEYSLKCAHEDEMSPQQR